MRLKLFLTSISISTYPIPYLQLIIQKTSMDKHPISYLNKSQQSLKQIDEQIDITEKRTDKFSQYLQDQCKFFFNDFNMPSKSEIMQIEKEDKFADVKTFEQAGQSPIYNEEEFFEQNQTFQQLEQKPREQKQQNRGKRSRKTQKASQYSKNYRDKKKEKLKWLEEQNQYLKKKINELQNRLREKELELNRIKFGKHQEEYDLQKLNADLMKKLNLIADNCVDKIVQTQGGQLSEEKKRQREVQQFKKLFESHGFGGLKTQEVLHYYSNEFLQNVMRDREKYLLLVCVKKKYLNPTKSPFDIALSEVVQRTEQQAKQMQMIIGKLAPTFEQLVEKCRIFQASALSVINVLSRINTFSLNEFQFNMEETKKRMKIAVWFQVNQHRKEMRKIRAEWIDLVKGEQQVTEENRGVPRKKKENKLKQK